MTTTKSPYPTNTHHLSPTSSLEKYGDALDVLFGGSSNNPYSVNSVNNLIHLPASADFANVLGLLSPEQRAMLGNIGLNNHPGGHSNYNDFVNSIYSKLLNEVDAIRESQGEQAARDFGQKGVASLNQFLREMAKSGHPPIVGTTLEQLSQAYLGNYTLVEKINSSPTLASDLEAAKIAWTEMSDAERYFDANTPNANNEMNLKLTIDLYKAALDNNLIHDDLRPIYQTRLQMMQEDARPGSNTNITHFSAKEVGNFRQQVWVELGKSLGFGDDNGPRSGLSDPSDLMPADPERPSDQKLEQYQSEIDAKKALDKAHRDAKSDTPDTVQPDQSMDGVNETLNRAQDLAKRMGDVLGDETSGSSFIPEAVAHDISRLQESLNHYYDLAKKATNATEFGDVLGRIHGAVKGLNEALNNALKDIPNGKLLGFAGALGDLLEFTQIIGDAYDQYAAGETQGALLTLADGLTDIAAGIATAWLAGTAMATLGLTGWPVVAAMLFGGYFGPILKDMFLEGAADLWDGLGEFPDLFNSLPSWFDELFDWMNQPAIDPLVIDLDGDGIELTSLESQNISFDLDNDGFAERTGWVSPDDGFLAVDYNGNGVIDDVTELFGSPDQPAFEALSAYDTDGNGVVNAQDANFGELLVWQDANSNGVAEAGELRTLNEVGITGLSLQLDNQRSIQLGNTIVAQGEVTFSDGSASETAEVLFDLRQAQTVFELPEGFVFANAVEAHPYLRGFGEMADLWVAMTEDTGLVSKSEDLSASLIAGDIEAFELGMDALLFDWAKVEEVRWIQSFTSVRYSFAYDAEAFAQSSEWARPPVKGYVIGVHDSHNEAPIGFAPDYWDVAFKEKGEAWLVREGLVAPVAFSDGVRTASEGPGERFAAAFRNKELEFIGTSGTTYLSSHGDAPEATPEIVVPDMDPRAFAFLQKLMGQDFTVAGNFVVPDNVIAANLDEDDVEVGEANFDQVKDYFSARYAVQAAHLAVSKDVGGDLGGLAPFANLFYNPFKDTIHGDKKGFVEDIVTYYRSTPYGDAAAIEWISKLTGDLPYLPALLLSLFPDIDSVAFSEAFESGSVSVGTPLSDNMTTDETITAVVGGSGDDILSSGAANTAIIGGEGADTISAGYNRTQVIYSMGDGDDTISAFSTWHEKSTVLAFTDIVLEQVEFSRNSDGDLLISVENGDTITIARQFFGEHYNVEIIEFADGYTLGYSGISAKLVYDQNGIGDDLVIAGYGNDVIFGGLGNDTLNAEAGSDTYIYHNGDGNDVITDYSTADIHVDKLELSDVNAGDVAFARSGNDLTISFSDGAILTISNHFLNSFFEMEIVEFADGTQLDSEGIVRKVIQDLNGPGDDLVLGGFSSDTIYGGQGDDTLNGGYGSDTYIVSASDGSDVIIDYSTSSFDNDTLLLADTTSDDVTFTQNSGQDLVVSFSNGGMITITDHFANQYYGLEAIEFSDGTRLDQVGINLKSTSDQNGDGNDLVLGGFSSDTVYGGQGDDTLNGGYGADTYIVSASDGSDVIVDYSTSSFDSDTLLLADATSDDVTFAQNSGQDLVVSFSNGEMITITDHFANQYYGLEAIEFSDGTRLDQVGINLKSTSDQNGDGNDLVLGGFSSDTVYGGQGDDTLNGGYGSDTYIVSASDGSDVIVDYSTSSFDNDTLLLADATSDDVTFAQNSGQDLVVSFSNGEMITITDHFANQYYGLEAIEFSDGTRLDQVGINLKSTSDQNGDGNDLVRGSYSSDIIHAGQGNDTLEGAYGADTYVYSAGNGDDVIYDFSYSNSQVDTLIFRDIDHVDLTVGRDGNDLVFEAISGGKVSVLDHFGGHHAEMEKIVFSDGSEWNGQDIASNLDWII